MGMYQILAQTQCLRAGGWQIHECVAEDPESAGFRMDRSMVEVNRMVADIRPDALVAASMGGHTYWNCGLIQPSALLP